MKAALFATLLLFLCAAAGAYNNNGLEECAWCLSRMMKTHLCENDGLAKLGIADITEQSRCIEAMLRMGKAVCEGECLRDPTKPAIADEYASAAAEICGALPRIRANKPCHECAVADFHRMPEVGTEPAMYAETVAYCQGYMAKHAMNGACAGQCAGEQPMLLGVYSGWCGVFHNFKHNPQALRSF